MSAAVNPLRRAAWSQPAARAFNQRGRRVDLRAALQQVHVPVEVEVLEQQRSAAVASIAFGAGSSTAARPAQPARAAEEQVRAASSSDPRRRSRHS
jgi:hypothetical protein